MVDVVECTRVCVSVCCLYSVGTDNNLCPYTHHMYTPPPVEDAVDRLHELSPFDLKHLLHLILSRKEFSVDESECPKSYVCVCVCVCVWRGGGILVACGVLNCF